MRTIWTTQSTPFALGGTHRNIKIEVEAYERIEIGCGYFGIVVRNPYRNLFHVAEENCGALVGSGKDKDKIVARVQKDVSTGDPNIMAEQVAGGIKDRDRAVLVSIHEFFKSFSKG